jgi:outer membrane autotransporter protein
LKSLNSTIGTLTNSGTISGVIGISDNYSSSETSIGALNNIGGTIIGSGNAIYGNSLSAMGIITNTGVISGNIELDMTGAISIVGATADSFGTLTGYHGGSIDTTVVGAITHANQEIDLSGRLLLNDNINAGTGTVYLQDLSNSSVLQVVNPVTITGNYSQAAATTLLSSVADNAVVTGNAATDSGYGRLIVSGNATIAPGASVVLKALNAYVFAQGQRFVLVQAATASYNTALLNYSAAGYNGTVAGSSVADNGNTDLLVTLGTSTSDTSGTPSGGGTPGSSTSPSGSATPNTSNFLPVNVATSGNAISALDGLFRYGGINSGLLSVFNPAAALSSPAAANRAGAQLSPAAISGATAQASVAATQTVMNVAAAHIDSLRLAQADGGDSGVSTGEADYSPTSWGQAFGGQATQNMRDGVSGYRASFGGLLMGADVPVSERWRAGGLVSFSDTSLSDNDDNAGSGGHIQSYGLTGYTSYAGNPWYINLMAGAATQHTNTARTVNFAGFSGINTGSFNGMQYTTAIQFGYPLSLDRWIYGTTLTPLVGLSYSHLRQNGYTESGSASALNVNASNSNSLRSEVGTKLSRQFITAYGILVPTVELDWRHEYQNTPIQSSAGFTADTTGATTFATQSASAIANTGVLNLGLTLLKRGNLSVSAQYVLEVASGYRAQTGDVQVHWRY